MFVDGAPVPVGGRAFDLLVALVDRAGRVVTKDELLQLLWPREVVEEGTLYVHIGALRKVLGPDAIRNVRGLGWRVAAP